MSADMKTLRAALAQCLYTPAAVWVEPLLHIALDELEALRNGDLLSRSLADPKQRELFLRQWGHAEAQERILELKAQRDELRTALVACRDYLASTREVPEELVEWCMADAALANTRGGQ